MQYGIAWQPCFLCPWEHQHLSHGHLAGSWEVLVPSLFRVWKQPKVAVIQTNPELLARTALQIPAKALASPGCPDLALNLPLISVLSEMSDLTLLWFPGVCHQGKVAGALACHVRIWWRNLFILSIVSILPEFSRHPNSSTVGWFHSKLIWGWESVFEGKC